jgi:hypothetical protein
MSFNPTLQVNPLAPAPSGAYSGVDPSPATATGLVIATPAPLPTAPASGGPPVAPELGLAEALQKTSKADPVEVIKPNPRKGPHVSLFLSFPLPEILYADGSVNLQ